MKYSLLAAAFILTGCATDVVNTPIPVDVPVGVLCKISPIPAPVFDIRGVSSSSSLFEQVRALAATNEQRKAYEAVLEAAVKSCS